MSLQDRGGKVKQIGFRRGLRGGIGHVGAAGELPHILAGDSLSRRGGCDSRRRANERKPIIWGLGGHVIKCGLAPVLIDLMRRGFATGVRDERCGIDPRFRNRARSGHTSEDVEAVLPDGRFGSAEETGREWNQAVVRWPGYRRRTGRWRLRACRPTEHRLTACSCRPGRAKVPVTVHVAMGTDTPHAHPACDPTRFGRGHSSRFPPVLYDGV